MNFSKNHKLARVADSASSAGTPITSDALDTANFEGVTFMAAFGTIAAGGTPAIKVQGADAPDGDFTDFEGSAVGVTETDDNAVAVVEVYRPLRRYLRAVVTREGGNAALDGIFAILSGPRVKPVSHDETVAASGIVISPEEAAS